MVGDEEDSVDVFVEGSFNFLPLPYPFKAGSQLVQFLQKLPFSHPLLPPQVFLSLLSLSLCKDCGPVRQRDKTQVNLIPR